MDIIDTIIGSEEEALHWQISDDRLNVELIYWNGKDESLLDFCVVAPIDYFKMDGEVLTNDYYKQYSKAVTYTLPHDEDSFDICDVISIFHDLYKDKKTRKLLTISNINE